MQTEDTGVRYMTPMAKASGTYDYWMATEPQYYGAGVGGYGRIYRFSLTFL